MGGTSDRASGNTAHYTTWPRQAGRVPKSDWSRTRICIGYGYVTAWNSISVPTLMLPTPIAVNPSQKLDWYEDHMPEKLGQAKTIFIQAVSTPVKADPNQLTNYVTYSFESTGKEPMLLRLQISQTCPVRRQQLAFWVLGGRVAARERACLSNERWTRILMIWRKGLVLSHIGRCVEINIGPNTIL